MGWSGWMSALLADLFCFVLFLQWGARHRFTLEEEEEEEAKEQRRSRRFRLTRQGPLRVFGAVGEEEEDDERNNIVGVTLAGDGTVLMASKVGWCKQIDDPWTDRTRAQRPLSFVVHLHHTTHHRAAT